MFWRRCGGLGGSPPSGQHGEQGVDDDRTDQTETEKFGDGVGADKFQHAQYTGNRGASSVLTRISGRLTPSSTAGRHGRSDLAFVLLLHEPASLGRRSGWPTNTSPTRRGLWSPLAMYEYF